MVPVPDKTRDVVAYICANYPHAQELSKARVTKMVYLADWKSALDHGRQITPIEWVFNHYGPYVEHVVDSIRADPAFEVVLTSNMYGKAKEVVRVRGEVRWPDLDAQDVAVLDHVIARTAPKYWDQFIKLVYSTYPILTRPRMAILDLVALAGEYREQAQQVEWG